MPEFEALISIDRPAADDPREPAALLRVTGLPVLEHQLRALRRLGVRRVALLSASYPESLHKALSRLRHIPDTVEVLDTRYVKPDQLGLAPRVLVLEEAVLLDDGALQMIRQAEPGAVLVMASRDYRYGLNHASVINQDYRFASVLVASDASVRSALQAAPGGQFLPHLLDQLKTGAQPVLLPADRGGEAGLWRPVPGARAGAKAGAWLQARAATDTDAITRWLYPLPVRLLLPGLDATGLSAGVLRTVILLLGLGLTGPILQGYVMPAAALALLWTILLAAARRFSRLRSMEEGAETVFGLLENATPLVWMGVLLTVPGDSILSLAPVVSVAGFGLMRLALSALARKEPPGQRSTESPWYLNAVTGLWLFLPFLLAGYTAAGALALVIHAMASALHRVWWLRRYLSKNN